MKYLTKSSDVMYEAETNFVTNEDVIGCIGQWLDMNNDQIPQEALRHLEEAYRICADQLR